MPYEDINHTHGLEMLPFSSLVELGKVGAELGVDEDTGEGAARLFGKINSISQMAKQSIMEYPIVVSTQLGDSRDNVFKIVKTLELYYAQFTMISAGLNPVVEKGTIGTHLGRFAGENQYFLPIKVEKEGDKPAIYCELVGNDPEKIQAAESLWQYLYSKEKVYTEVNSAIKDAFSEEDSILNRTGNGSDDRLDPDYSESDQDNATFLTAGGNRPVEISQPGVSNIMVDQFKKFLASAHPTMVTVNLYVGAQQKQVQVTLGIKCMPHFVGKEELTMLFESVFENQRKHFRWLQLQSGEISFFKDFLLNMDRIQKDKRLYATLGRHPWYRRLLNRKNQSIFEAIGKMIPVFKNFMKDKRTLPTCSLLVGADEMAYSNMSMSYLMRNKRHIDKLMNELMLLSLVVYDVPADLVYFYFNGFSEPLMYRTSDLSSGSSGKDNTQDYIKIMNKMMNLY